MSVLQNDDKLLKENLSLKKQLKTANLEIQKLRKEVENEKCLNNSIADLNIKLQRNVVERFEEFAGNTH